MKYLILFICVFASLAAQSQRVRNNSEQQEIARTKKYSFSKATKQVTRNEFVKHQNVQYIVEHTYDSTTNGNQHTVTVWKFVKGWPAVRKTMVGVPITETARRGAPISERHYVEMALAHRD